MEIVGILSMIFGKKPIVEKYVTDVEKCKKEKDFYLNTLLSDDNKYHTFRCPNRKCKAPVKIGHKRCWWCKQRLKWEYPFESYDAN